MKYDYVRHDCNVNDVFSISHRLVSEFSLIGHKMVMLLKFLLRLERNWKMLKPRYSELKQDVGLLQTWSHMVDMFLIVKILKNGKICQTMLFPLRKSLNQAMSLTVIVKSAAMSRTLIVKSACTFATLTTSNFPLKDRFNSFKIH